LFLWFLFAALRLSVRNFLRSQDPFLKALSLAMCGIVAFYAVLQVFTPTIMAPSISFLAFALFSFLVILPNLESIERINESLATGAAPVPTEREPLALG
jgi:hypothetical protein